MISRRPHIQCGYSPTQPATPACKLTTKQIWPPRARTKQARPPRAPYSLSPARSCLTLRPASTRGSSSSPRRLRRGAAQPSQITASTVMAPQRCCASGEAAACCAKASTCAPGAAVPMGAWRECSSWWHGCSSGRAASCCCAWPSSAPCSMSWADSNQASTHNGPPLQAHLCQNHTDAAQMCHAPSLPLPDHPAATCHVQSW